MSLHGLMLGRNYSLIYYISIISHMRMKNFTRNFALAALLGLALSSQAENRIFTYTDLEGYPVYGPAFRVSPNGRYVVGGDENEQTGGFFIDTTRPEQIILTADGELADVDDNGLAVGTWYRKEGYAKYCTAATYKDGVWSTLPLPEEVIGQSYVRAISADSKIICGHAVCQNYDPELPGMHFPITWKLNEETGKYEVLKIYNDLYLPGTQGFYVYDMSPNAKWACGLHCLDMGDFVDVVVDLETGELFHSNKIEYKEYTWESVHPVTGEPIILTDNLMFVDDLLDGFDGTTLFAGRFTYATDRYLYGQRGIVSDVKEDGSGNITHRATVFDTETRTFLDGSSQYGYTCGEGEDLRFTTNGKVMIGTSTTNINKKFGLNNPTVAGIYSLDRAGKVLTGSYIAVTALGDMIECPVVIMLDEGLVGIDTITAEDTKDFNIIINGNTVSLPDAQQVMIVSLNGQMITNQKTATLDAGLYLVVADGKAKKVLIK